MIDIIYTAAGNSERFGKNKLLENLRGMPLYKHGLEKLCKIVSSRSDCTLTLITQYEEIIRAEKNINCIFSPESKKGLSYTVKKAVESLSYNENDFFMFVNADMPFVKEETYIKLINSVDSETTVSRLYFEDTPSNPVIFSARLAPELLSLEGDGGGSRIIKKHRLKKVYAFDKTEILDIDTGEQLNLFKENGK